MSIRRDAVFSADQLHRFELSRIWNRDKGLALFIGLNPSKAGKDFDDMTVRKGIGFAHRWGLGGTMHGNAFSRISTDPKFLANCVDAYRSENWDHLMAMAARARVIVYAWGSFPQFESQFAKVRALIDKSAPKCLGLTADGFPKHISRIAYSTPLVEWSSATEVSHG